MVLLKKLLSFGTSPRVSIVVITIIVAIVIMCFFMLKSTSFVLNQKQGPSILHDSLKLELVSEGLSFPTSMTFIDENNILVLEKNNGMVRLVSNGILREDPVLKLQVDSEGERGLLGIDVMRNNNSNDNNSNNIIDRKESDILVYLYFTRLVKNSTNNDGDDQEQSLKN